MNKRLVLQVAGRSHGFCSMLFGNASFITLAVVFILGKLAANLAMGASWFNALRSGLMGFVFYVLACYVVHILSKPDSDLITDDTRALTGSYQIAVWTLLLFFILTIQVMNSYEVITLEIPVWGRINSLWQSFVAGLAEKSDYIEGTGLVGWPYLLLYVVVPAVILWKNSGKLPQVFGFKLERIGAALPFVIIYVLAFTFIRGITVANLLNFAFVLIWPGLGEEFFFRGVIQRQLVKAIGNPVTAIVLTSFIFAVSHIPIYVFGSSYSWVRLGSALLPLMFTSFFWGYGYYRTGVLWPWAVIHALSNLVGF
ncbi:MAG TPA: CPBP family intramembrane metalloprotease [Firmicutes bacterium]|nr:CPBP family intramembrane metalloprotease [Bacillota bacterium]